MPSFLILLLSLGVSLRFSYNSSHGASAATAPAPPPTPPYHPHPHHHHHDPTSGNKVVIVVHNEPSSSGAKLGAAPIPRPLTTSENQRKEKRSNLKSVFLPAGLNQQGFLLATSGLDDTSILKKRKGTIQKIVHASPRHISSVPSDVFGKAFHIHKSGTSLADKIGNNPSIMEFRPHQPDITPDSQSGKLTLPGGYSDDQGLSSIKYINPTPMANQINPYTNGVASSFPPGIDPYEGFIRYAAENLDSPMGNIIDYHSLEHYYGPQHPLSPHHNVVNVGKENNLDNHPYADSFSYSGRGESSGAGSDIGNSPPLASPPPPVGTAGNNLDGFRARDNPEGNGPGSGLGGNSGYNSVSPYEHGIDHFHAPSPGLGSAPPIPRYVANEPSSYEDYQSNAPPSPPYSHSPEEEPPFTGKPRASPFKNTPLRIPPPDLRVFEEGPPPELMGNHPGGPPGPSGPGLDGPSPGPGFGGGPSHGPGFGGPGPGPSSAGPSSGYGHGPGPQEHAHQPPHHSESEQQETPQDGGDDSIWGILDIAEMLQKGQIPGTPDDKNKGSSPSTNNRVVIPVRGGMPPKGYPSESSSSPYDYDEGGAGEGGNRSPPHPHPQYASQDSEEANNDYEDQYSK